MQNSTLSDLLRSLSKEELKEFDLMVNSPFYNRKSAVTKFWESIYSFAPEFDSPAMEREKLYDKVFPGKEFNYGTMKNLVYDLTKIAEKFIELKTYSKDTSRRSINLLGGYLERGLNSFFEKSLRSAEKDLEEKKGEISYHSCKHLLEILKQNYLIQQDKRFQTRESIRILNENLTRGYFIDIIVNNYNSLFMQDELTGKPGNEFIEKVLAFYKTAPVEMDFRVNIYYNAFMLVWNGSVEYFSELRREIEENVDKLSSEQKYNFFVALVNYCIKKYEEGQTEFAKKEYEIYLYMIENSIYSIDKVKNMDGAFYKNVAKTALIAGELDWAMYFIEKYKEMLEPEVRENYYYHALVEYYLKLRNFPEVRRYLAKIKYTNFIDKLVIKRWEMMTSYELKNFEELRYQIDSAKHFLQSDKKVSAARKELLSNFVHVVNKLLLLNEKDVRDRSDIHELIKELDVFDTSNKSWLMEKIDEMKIN